MYILRTSTIIPQARITLIMPDNVAGFLNSSIHGMASTYYHPFLCSKHRHPPQFHPEGIIRNCKSRWRWCWNDECWLLHFSLFPLHTWHRKIFPPIRRPFCTFRSLASNHPVCVRRLVLLGCDRVCQKLTLHFSIGAVVSSHNCMSLFSVSSESSVRRRWSPGVRRRFVFVLDRRRLKPMWWFWLPWRFGWEDRSKRLWRTASRLEVLFIGWLGGLIDAGLNAGLIS